MTANEWLLARHMASLTERQGRVVLSRLALFDDETLGLDVSAVLFDQERWDIIYADELAEVLMPILVDGWISGTAKLRAAIGKAAKAVKAPIDGWDVFNQEVLSWAQRYPRFFAERVNTAFAKRITEVIASGLAKGENIRDLRKRLSRDVFNGDVTKYRAEMIARTEGSRASHAGENQAWQQSGVVEAKIWKAFPDACQFCRKMDGKQISIGEHYFELGQEADGVDGGKMPMNYETVEAPPLHVHCHCDEEPVLKGVEGVEAIPVIEAPPVAPKKRVRPVSTAANGKTMTDADKRVLQRYTGLDHVEVVQAQLGKPLPDWASMNREQALKAGKKVEAALKKLPGTKGEFFRGLKFDTVEDQARFLADMKPDSVYKFGAFQSTSADRAVAESFMRAGKKKQSIMMVIDGKSGRDVRDFSRNANEAEVLFMPGSTFKVTRIVGNIVHLAEL